MNGQIVAAFGRQYEVLRDDGQLALCFPRAKKSQFTCGDRVALSENGDAIDELLPRNNLLYRADAFKEKLLAANLTQIIIVVATEPGFSDELVSRCISAAESQDIDVLIVLNKCDLGDKLAEARERLEQFTRIPYPVLELSALSDAQILRERLVGQTSLLVGQSGMGKSTLTNALIPEAQAATREISEVLDSGKHTTTHARLYPLPEGGVLIDSPGVQVFGLAQLGTGEVEASFREIREILGTCRFRDCRHENEPDCAVRLAVTEGRMHPRRHLALCALLAEKRAARTARHR
ncbi:ribosome small subunit-dependent GTPase A [Viridibacterium curvum]|uniref:Small ribosomal subunit biogenesis GTPase RsgA n=1 Tax=Viridibacterium curvum TaxID=1101404 RepID=A0ABP9R1M6_9RHOO